MSEASSTILPEGYSKMSMGQQKKARLQVMFDQSTPESTVRSWVFFRRYYLDSLPEGVFYKRKRSSPVIHYEWIRGMAQYARNIYGAPRSFAKSIVLGTEWPLLLALTRPPIHVLTVVANKDFAVTRGQRFMKQLTGNSRIRADFGDLKSGPRAGERIWAKHHIDLSNGSLLETVGFGSQHLGVRPDFVIWDDLEPDPQQVRDWERIVNDMMNALFNVFLPMLDGGTAMAIIGTLLHKRSFMYWAMTTRDRRMGFWNRRLSAIMEEYPDGKPTWPEKFNAPTIKRLEAELGTGPFMAQYMNAPVAGQETTLKLHPRRNFYTVDNPDRELQTDPLSSQALLTYWKADEPKEAKLSKDWSQVSEPFGEAVSSWFRFIVVDFAEQRHARADFSVVHVMAVDPQDVLWSLDLWAGRESLKTICDHIWSMTEKWQVRLVAIEAIGPYQALYERAVADRGEIERRMGWLPSIMKLSYPASLSKTARICGLEWRIERGRLRIPDRVDGPWRALRFQIDSFSPDVPHGGLRYDDILDTLSAHAYVLRIRTRRVDPDLKDSAQKTFARRLCEGEKVHRGTGIPYITGMNADELPVQALLEEHWPKTKGRKDETLHFPRGVWTIPQLVRYVRQARSAGGASKKKGRRTWTARKKKN